MNLSFEELFHPEHTVWYVGPFQLIITWGLIHSIAIPALLRIHKNTEEIQSKVRDIFLEKTKETNGKIPRLSYLEYFLLLVLIYCEYYQIQFKFLPGIHGGLHLLYPCHILTFFFLYIMCVYEYSAYMINSLVPKNKNPKQPPSKNVKYYQNLIQECMFLFNMYTGYTWFGIMALVTPDTSDITSNFHYFIFWFHHVIIGFLPLYVLCFSKSLVVNLVEKSEQYFFQMGTTVAVLFFFDLQLPLSVFFDMNINYMLLPPPPLPMTGPLYHWQIMPLCTFAVFIFVYVCRYLQKLTRFDLLTTKTQESKKKAK